MFSRIFSKAKQLIRNIKSFMGRTFKPVPKKPKTPDIPDISIPKYEPETETEIEPELSEEIEATIQLEAILSKIITATNYETEKTNVSGQVMVQSSAWTLFDIITEARGRYSDKEIMDRLISQYGSFSDIDALIQKLILAVYDKDYARWAGGRHLYDAEINMLTEVLS